MRRQHFGTFVGGIDLPDEKYTTDGAAIEPVPQPRVLYVLLDPCRLGSVDLQVAEGQRVSRGDLIALAGDRMPIFAPLDGTVGRAGRSVLAGHTAGSDADEKPHLCSSLELTDLGAWTVESNPEPVFDWRQASAEELLKRIDEGGLTTFSEPLTPLGHWCRQAVAAGVDTVIVNGMENQPYLTCDHRLMVSHGAEIVTAAAILVRVLGVTRGALAVDSRRIDRYRQMAVWAETLEVQSLAIEHKYPMGNDIMLASVVAGRVPRPGESPTDVGVAVIGPACCAALSRWVLAGERPTWRVVTVSGEHVRRPGNVAVPFGMPAEHVLAARGAPIEGSFCHGGPMTGTALAPETVVGPATSGLLSLRPPDERPASACIRCGWCTDHCPVRLDVASLNDMFELGNLDRARRYDVVACLGCGVCSYVCPARLPLTHRVKTLKRIVRQVDAASRTHSGAAHG